MAEAVVAPCHAVHEALRPTIVSSLLNRHLEKVLVGYCRLECSKLHLRPQTDRGTDMHGAAFIGIQIVGPKSRNEAPYMGRSNVNKGTVRRAK